MPLVNLTTNLKNNKFGNDRPYGGNSGQPYIQIPILFPNPIGALDQDFILRGGAHTAVDTSLDVSRLTKYFTDIRNPSGFLFFTKQNLLSRTAVRTQASTGLSNEGAYTPLSTLAQASVSAFGLHFNKQGLNPIPGTPGSLTTYSNVVTQFQPNDVNRLVQIFNKKQNAYSLYIYSIQM